MATRVWRAAAAPTAQVETITITGPVVAGENWSVTINGRTVTFEATAGTTANVATGLAAALNASELAEFAEVTWAASDPDVVGTADAEGVPFALSVSTDSAGGSIATLTTVDATGPNNWADASNWSGAAVPVNGDTVVVDLSQGSVLYGLDQSAVTLAALTVFSPAFTGNTLGLPLRNAAGYSEYRDTYLAIGATACVVDCGAQRVKLNFGAVQTSCDVRRTGGSAETGVPAVLLRGSHASNAIEVRDGSAGLAFHGGETLVAATVTVNATAQVIAGDGASLGTVETVGSVSLRTNVTTLDVSGGETLVAGAATVGTLNIDGDGAIVRYESTGTCTAANIGPGLLDASRDLSPRTFTTTTIFAGGRILDPHNTITHTNDVALDASVDEVIAN